VLGVFSLFTCVLTIAVVKTSKVSRFEVVIKIKNIPELILLNLPPPQAFLVLAGLGDEAVIKLLFEPCVR